MSEVKRLRIIAGPNGSGKTSFYLALSKMEHPRLGIFINADDIESTLKTKGIISFSDYCLETKEGEIESAFVLFKQVRETTVEEQDFYVQDNFLVVSVKDKIDSYFASFIAEFIRDSMLIAGIAPFTMETVMSHPSKLDVMKRARELGYRVYLYYIATLNAQINLERVKARTEKGGHFVSDEKIISRYDRSLDLLYDAILLSDRSYLIDNSSKNNELVAEYEASTNTLTMSSEDCPDWVGRYFLDKNK